MRRTDPDRPSPTTPHEGSPDDLPVVIKQAAPVALDPEALALVRRLRRVQGQVAGLVKMVEAGRDCGDIVTQLSAAEHALHRVGFLLVIGEMRKCSTAGEDGERDAEARIAAAEKLFLRLA